MPTFKKGGHPAKKIFFPNTGGIRVFPFTLGVNANPSSCFPWPLALGKQDRRSYSYSIFKDVSSIKDTKDTTLYLNLHLEVVAVFPRPGAPCWLPPGEIVRKDDGKYLLHVNGIIWYENSGSSC
jgi:hypothetical protein